MAVVKRTSIPFAVKQAVWAKTQGRCWYCGDVVMKAQRTCQTTEHMEHQTPVAQGGLNTLDNLVLACSHCNFEKNNRTVDQFRQKWAKQMASSLLGSMPRIIEDDDEPLSPFFEGFFFTLTGYAEAIRGHRVLFYGEYVGENPSDYQI